MTQLKRGKYVKRSTYQKVVEENKLLKADIKLLVMQKSIGAAMECAAKWRKKFELDEAFIDALKTHVQSMPKIAVVCRNIDDFLRYKKEHGVITNSYYMFCTLANLHAYKYITFMRIEQTAGASCGIAYDAIMAQLKKQVNGK